MRLHQGVYAEDVASSQLLEVHVDGFDGSCDREEASRGGGERPGHPTQGEVLCSDEGLGEGLSPCGAVPNWRSIREDGVDACNVKFASLKGCEAMDGGAEHMVCQGRHIGFL